MNLLLFVTLPSIVIVFGLALLIGLTLESMNPRKLLRTMRDIVIPLGVCGTLIGIVSMLQLMDDPRTIGPAVGIALLSSLYGLGLYIIFTAGQGLLEVSASTMEAFFILLPTLFTYPPKASPFRTKPSLLSL